MKIQTIILKIRTQNENTDDNSEKYVRKMKIQTIILKNTYAK